MGIQKARVVRPMTNASRGLIWYVRNFATRWRDAEAAAAVGTVAAVALANPGIAASSAHSHSAKLGGRLPHSGVAGDNLRTQGSLPRSTLLSCPAAGRLRHCPELALGTLYH